MMMKMMSPLMAGTADAIPIRSSYAGQAKCQANTDIQYLPSEYPHLGHQNLVFRADGLPKNRGPIYRLLRALFNSISISISITN